MEYTLFGALCLVTLAGLVLSVLQLPGTWLILAASAGYDWYHKWQAIGWKWLAALAAAAIVAEAVELASSAIMARKGGASRRASICAVIGGMAGMILLSVPVPVIGTIIGGFIGCFVGAVAGELTIRDDLAAGAKVGVFATIGRLVGIMAKTSVALVMGGAVLVLAARAIW